MVGSRHLQGTIISRVKYLLESGSLKKPPVWFDVVKRFPPTKTSLLSLVDEVEQTPIPKLSHPDDDIKREFHKNFERAIRDPQTLFNDIQVEKTKTDFFLQNYKELLTSGKSEDEAFNESCAEFSKHLESIRDQKHVAKQHTSTSDDVVKTNTDKADITLNEFYNIFKT